MPTLTSERFFPGNPLDAKPLSAPEARDISER